MEKQEQQEEPKTTASKKIRCIRPDCLSTGEFQYIGAVPKSMTIVDDTGKVVFHTAKYYYKCMACGATFQSDVPPQMRGILHG